MISIKPTFWKRSNVIWAVFIGAFCLCPLVLQSLAAPSSLAGLGAFVGLAVLCWLMLRPIRLEITETEVWVKEGWSRAPLGKKEAFRSEICSIHYAPKAAAMSGKRGWDLAGDMALGAVTGALSDSGLGDARGLTVGAVSGVANSFGGDLINTHQVSVSDAEWAAFSGSLGAAENGFESRISNTSPSGVRRSATPWVFW
jgi:hypothetical protein